MPFSNRLAPPLKIVGPSDIDARRTKRTGLGFIKWSPGPDTMRKDCAVRALTLATGIPYEQVFKELQEDNNKYAGRKALIERGGTYNRVTANFLARNGWKKLKNIGKVLLKKDQLPDCPCVVRVAGHILYVEKGRVWDTWDSRGDRSRRVQDIWVELTH